MGKSVRELVSGDGNTREARIIACHKLECDFPNLYELFVGTNAAGDKPEISPATISFYAIGDRLKFKIWIKSPDRSFYGICKDVDDPFGSVETAILLGEISTGREKQAKYDVDSLPH